jgi:hypothetical protein
MRRPLVPQQEAQLLELGWGKSGTEFASAGA